MGIRRRKRMIGYVLTWVFAKLPRGERGQDLIEYAVFSGVIALTLMAVGALFLTGALNSMATGIGNCIDFDSTTGCAPF
jgi:Flp pilus assembly pilin Flp